jgi:hypothetical protein
MIGQLVFLELSKREKRERKLSGTYLAPVFPEAPIFKDPEEDLETIGIPRNQIRVPEFRDLNDPT